MKGIKRPFTLIAIIVAVIVLVAGLFYHLNDRQTSATSNNISDYVNSFDPDHITGARFQNIHTGQVYPDQNSFVAVEITGSSGCISFAKDKDHVYEDEDVLDGANPQTFMPLPDSTGKCSQYSKDDQHVYYQSFLTEGANPASFSVLTGYFAKDNNHVYYRGTSIANADVDSFLPLSDSTGNPTLYSKDKYHVYISDPQSSETGIIPGLNPKIFVLPKNLDDSYDTDSVKAGLVSNP